MAGGKRKGAGRKLGSTTKPQIRDFLNETKVKELVKKAEDMAKAGDPTMLKFVLEQVFGRATQTIGGDKDNPLVPEVITGMKIIKG